jgi:hypothetical protein
MRFTLSMYIWLSTPPTLGWKKSDIILDDKTIDQDAGGLEGKGHTLWKLDAWL